MTLYVYMIAYNPGRRKLSVNPAKESLRRPGFEKPEKGGLVVGF